MRKHGRIYKPILISDLGLIIKKAGTKYFAVTTDMKKGKPVSGATVEIKTYQNQTAYLGTSKVNGITELKKISDPNIDRLFYAVAKKGEDRAIIRLGEMKWNLSTFDTGGESLSQKGINAFIYTERGVYRPGDDIYVSVLIRNKEKTFPSNHPIQLILKNPKGTVLYNQLNKTGIDGFYSFKVPTSMNALTGRWSIEVKAGGESFYAPVKIETVVPNRLKIKLTLPKEPINSKIQTIPIELESTYLFGNPASDLNSEILVSFKKDNNISSQFSDYIFDDQTIKFIPRQQSILRQPLDSQGKLSYNWTPPKQDKSPTRLVATFTAKVIEKGGRPNLSQQTKVFNPYFYYIGLKRPESDHQYLEIGKAHSIQTICIDTNGKLVQGRSLKYKLYKNKKWWWWEYRDKRDRLQFKTSKNTVLLDEGNIISSTKPVSITITPDEWGEYLLEVQEGQNGHVSSFFFNASYWGAQGTESDTAGAMDVRLNKKTYEVGDTAQVIFSAPDNGDMFYTLEKGKQILTSGWKELSELPNIDQKTKSFSIDVTKEMSPNTFLTLAIIQPHAQTINDRPIRMYSVVRIKVEDPKSREEIILSTPKELKPQRPFTINLQTKSKEKSQFTIAVVDEGLLDLTGYSTPNIWGHFNKKLRLDVTTWDTFNNVLGLLKGDFFRTFLIGGGGFIAEQARQTRQHKAKRFKPVSLFKGPIWTDDEGKASVTFTMPNYIGSVKVMVVSANKGKYGRADKVIKVRSPLMITPTLPRVIGPGDVFEMPLSIFTMNNNMGNITSTLKVEGPLEIIGSYERKVQSTLAEEKRVFFKMRGKMEVGKAKVSVMTKSANNQASFQTEIDVRPSSPPINERTEYQLTPDKKIELNIPSKGIKGSQTASLILSKIYKLSISHRLKYLIRYPYGCIEQTISSSLPQLYLKNFIENKENTYLKIDENINAGIRRLKKFKQANGSFSYWPGEDYYNGWADNYAGYFLVSAKNKGYHVPSDLLDPYLKFQSRKAKTGNGSIPNRVYRVYILALANKHEMGAMNLLKENYLEGMSNPLKWMLAASYHLAGAKRVGSAIIKTAKDDVENKVELSGTYGSPLRDKAIILDCMVMLGEKAKAKNLFEGIKEQVSSKDWYNTQALGYSLTAMGKYLGQSRKDSKTIKVELNSGKASKSILMTSTQKEISLMKYIDKKVKLKLHSSSEGKLYAYFENDYIPLIPKNKALNNNLNLNISYYTDEGVSTSPGNLRQGRSYYVKIDVHNISKHIENIFEVALSYYLPAGWEMENSRIFGGALPTWIHRMFVPAKFSYMDQRDDRIDWFFNIVGKKKHSFLVKINAVTLGEFQLPPSTVKSMYNYDFRAMNEGIKISVQR